MTETFYRTVTRNSKSFGGLIYASDFDTEYKGKSNKDGSIIASRIASDLRFDKRCMENVKNKERNQENEAYI